MHSVGHEHGDGERTHAAGDGRICAGDFEGFGVDVAHKGGTALGEGGLMEQVKKDFGSYDAFLARLKALAMTRGVGWAMLYYCSETGHLLTQWVDEQHLGHLAGPKLILAVDMWEHSFVFDYQPSGKKQYVEDFFANLNWSKVEERFGK